MLTFADRLRGLRAEANMKQSDVAALVNTVPSAVSYWESGRGVPHLDIIQKLADHFGVSMDYMLGQSDYRRIEVPMEKIEEPLAILMRGDLKKLPPEVQKEIAAHIQWQIAKYGKPKE